jgi:hypothetical protein
VAEKKSDPASKSSESSNSEKVSAPVDIGSNYEQVVASVASTPLKEGKRGKKKSSA